jgi:hypothetical protein
MYGTISLPLSHGTLLFSKLAYVGSIGFKWGELYNRLQRFRRFVEKIKSLDPAMHAILGHIYKIRFLTF